LDSHLLFREYARRALEEHWRKAQSQVLMSLSGGSMGTTLPDGSKVIVSFSERPHLKRNRIVYIRRGTRRVVHRLTAAIGPFCLEKGDALPFPSFCWRKDILGTISLTSPSRT
jgi:hypothetical protein